MVIIVEVENFLINKVLIDQGISVNILYQKTFKKLQIQEQQIFPYVDEIVGFLRERVETRRYINLYTTFGERCFIKTISIRYLVLDANTSNNLGAIVSTPHLTIMYSTFYMFSRSIIRYQ